MTRLFAPLRHGVLAHIEAGRLRPLREWPVYTILHLLANKKIGIVEQCSAVYLAERFGLGCSFAQKTLESLERRRYIRRVFHRGTRRPYPIVIHKYKTVDGFMVDAWRSVFDWPQDLDANQLAVLSCENQEGTLALRPIGNLRRFKVKKKAAKKPPAFVINGQPIPGSVWGKLLRICKGDKWIAGELLYRARNKDHILAYIQNGLNTGTIFNVKTEEEGSGQGKEAWIRATIFKEKPKPLRTLVKNEEPTSLSDILDGIAI